MVEGRRLKAEESGQGLWPGQWRATGDIESGVEFSGGSIALTVSPRLKVDG
jgi:hypothetical protein